MAPGSPSPSIGGPITLQQVARLRRGMLGLVVLHCVTQVVGALLSGEPVAERAGIVIGIVVVMVAVVHGYQRGHFTSGHRAVVVFAVVGLAPLLGNAVLGSAFTCTWLLSLDKGARHQLTAVGFGVAVVVGAVAATGGTGVGDPGMLVGETASLLVMAFVLPQLRSSLDDQHHLQSALAYQANHDALTGLPNRHAFQARLTEFEERHRRTGAPYALLMLDLDGFKQVNDALGHDAGDELLRVIGRRVQAAVRSSELCARLGGDEFAVLVADCDDPDDVQAIARRVSAAVRRPIQIGPVVAHVGVSIGTSQGGSDALAALRHADVSMYSAKQHRRTALAA